MKGSLTDAVFSTFGVVGSDYDKLARLETDSYEVEQEER